MASRQLSAILAPLCTLVLLTLFLGTVGLQALSSGAELLAAEGRWAAAEHDAAAALERYARTGDEVAWNAFRTAVTSQPLPKGAFSVLPPLNRPLTLWRRADAELLELRALGDRVREIGGPEAAQAIPQIRAAHQALREHADRVLVELETALLRLRNSLFATLALAGVCLVAATTIAVRRFSRRVPLLGGATPEVRAAHRRAHETLHSIGDAVLTTDADDRVEYMNLAAERLTGWPLEEARGRLVNQICRHVGEPTLEPVTESEDGARQRSGTLVRRDGVTVAVHEHCSPLVDANGRVTGSVRVLRDVTRERAFARELAHQATHDGLTGLVNRNEFERQVATLIPVAEGTPPHALLYFDLDQFKTINDTCGHSAGDALLRRVAAQMHSRLRATDTLARLGGDEFCAVLRNCPLPQALEVAEGIRAHIAETRFVWQERTFAVSTSIGVLALDPAIADVAEALSAADQACYQSKEAGRNRVRLWRPDDRVQHARQSELHWLARLNNAFDANRFRLLGQRLQPLAAAGSRSLVEVLLRIEDERGQLVAPMAFIPAAERYGLMGRIDRWVIETACDALAKRGLERDGPCLLVNLSGASLSDAGLVGFVAACLERHALSPDRLGFEISETVAITQLHRATRLLGDLKSLGCRVVLDDFGGGMSAFVYLRDLKIDYLKIDGNLVCDMTRDPVMYAMVESIHRVARVMGIGTIAEWAEEPPQVDALTVIGADFAQGYAVHRPEALDDCLRGLPRADATRARSAGPLRLVP